MKRRYRPVKCKCTRCKRTRKAIRGVRPGKLWTDLAVELLRKAVSEHDERARAKSLRRKPARNFLYSTAAFWYSSP